MFPDEVGCATEVAEDCIASPLEETPVWHMGHLVRGSNDDPPFPSCVFIENIFPFFMRKVHKVSIEQGHSLWEATV